jgi:hypothetical protein
MAVMVQAGSADEVEGGTERVNDAPQVTLFTDDPA